MSLILIIICATSFAQNKPDPDRVTQVDLDRYTGLWYEIARIPNRFQNQCVKGVTAEYTLRDDGRIDVVNQCYKSNGKLDRAEGLARVVDTKTNSQLEVSFFSILGWRPVWGDYWIIDLAKDYSFAVVCSPDRKYGWILARETRLQEDILKGIFSRLEQQGFEPDVFKYTDQKK
jgi:apolipoprotein D and lipocalin family protein